MEYGTSFSASRAHGVFRSLQDTVYNMNLAHLTQADRTVFEHLDDAGLRTACTTYLIYRGRHRHEPSRDSPYVRLAEAAQFRHPVWGARELFYADLFDTRNTGCSSTLGMPGQRDRHAACVGERLVADDLFDFLLFSLPDNDSYSHREGPAAQPESIAEADRALARLMDAGGGAGRVPGRARRDRDVRPLARPCRGRHQPVRRAGRLAGAGARRPRPRERPAGRVPRRRARRRCTCWTARTARRWPRGWPATSRTWTGSTSSARLEAGRAVVSTPRGELRFAPGRRRHRRARQRLGRGRRPAGAGPVRQRRRGGLRRLPGRAAAAVVGAHVRAHRRPAAVGRAGLRVHRLGRRRPRGRRQPRVAARVRLAGRAADLRRRAGRGARTARAGRSRT